MGEVWVRFAVLAAVLVVATVGGLVWRARSGRVRQNSVSEAPTVENEQVWAQIGVEPSAAPVTLVQFSSAFCAPCRATRRVLSDVVSTLPEVHHVEVDAESHLDIVRALEVRSTPTTLLVDRTGRIAGRAVGAPRKTDVLAALGPFLAGSE